VLFALLECLCYPELTATVCAGSVSQALPDPSCRLLTRGPSSVSNGSRIRASHARKTRIASLCDCPMVLRSDKTEIENSESESEAVEMEVSRPFVRNFLNHASAGARNFTKM
jgi:hypothetical protein